VYIRLYIYMCVYIYVKDGHGALDRRYIILYCTQNLKEHQEENPAHNQESGISGYNNVHHRHITG